MAQKHKILFVCIHNSARSQMAEALVNHYYSDKFSAESAGLEEGTLNPFAVKAMNEIGIDISQNKTKKVFDFFKEGRIYKYVVTVCDEANAERCPVFPGVSKTIHWSFEDPSVLSGTDDEKLTGTIKIRDEIKKQIDSWIKSLY
jgi:arsenate reductase (thioredoxin)